MKKIEQFQITSMSISGFKSYEKPTELTFGNPTIITGGNGRGKTSIADAIAFAVTGLPFFGERGLDRLHNEKNPDVAIQMRFVDENGIPHELTRIRRNNDMSIYYDGHTIRQLDLADLFGERDVFLSILNPLYFIEELGTSGKNLLERYLPFIPQETILAQLPGEVQASLKDEVILSPDAYLKGRRAEIRELEERITYLGGQKDLAATQKKQYETMRVEFSEGITSLQNEIAALAEKQFAGLDTAKMQEKLVELSQRYDEMARDERGDTVQQQKELRALREKIVRRQSEQYQSKFTEPLAKIAAKVNDLGTRYKRESVAYKAFHAGMLEHLTLLDRHGENLLGRGLSEDRIRENGYRSMPETERGRQLLTDLLRSHGHDLHGVPGFRTYYGEWTLSGPSGFLIPVRNKDGLIQGLKIRLDEADHPNRKYRWLSSRNLPNGTRSYSWVHVTGDRIRKRAFLTEGPLKGDVASFLAKDALFICIGGVNALHGLTDTIRELGVHEVVEAMDMDQMTNSNVRNAILAMRKEVQKIPGIRYAKYTWNPAYKGVDDYLLSRTATM